MVLPPQVVAQTVQVAADVTTLVNSGRVARSTRTYWTAARLAKAKPMPLPTTSGPLSTESPSATLGPPQSASGQPPALKVLPNYNNVLFTPRARDLGAEPEMYGPAPKKLRFTSSRQLADALAATGAEATYPYALNGQLFFTIGEDTFVCSATVQRLRIITTAGHCVSDGHGHFYSNWLFVPALRNGVGPFGTWTWAFVVVSNTWHFGGGGVPNAQDVASIELADNDEVRIGSYTGYAGYQIPDLYTGQHVTANGYPCNIDNCDIMHRNDAAAFGGSKNTRVIGSDMRGGASGGGWLINWGEYGVGQPPASGLESGLLRLVAVTSYGPVSTLPLYLGASILDGRYVNGSTGVLDVACAHRAGNC
jgi:V8-like Glu-specific endopeptidase